MAKCMIGILLTACSAWRSRPAAAESPARQSRLPGCSAIGSRSGNTRPCTMGGTCTFSGSAKPSSPEPDGGHGAVNAAIARSERRDLPPRFQDGGAGVDDLKAHSGKDLGSMTEGRWLPACVHDHPLPRKLSDVTLAFERWRWHARVQPCPREPCPASSP